MLLPHMSNQKVLLCKMHIISHVFFNLFFFCFVWAGCNFVLADVHYTSKNVTEMFDLGMNVGSTHTRCLLEQKVEFFSHLIYIRCKTMDG